MRLALILILMLFANISFAQKSYIKDDNLVIISLLCENEYSALSITPLQDGNLVINGFQITTYGYLKNKIGSLELTLSDSFLNTEVISFQTELKIQPLSHYILNRLLQTNVIKIRYIVADDNLATFVCDSDYDTTYFKKLLNYNLK